MTEFQPVDQPISTAEQSDIPDVNSIPADTRAAIKQWLSRIKAAKAKFEPDFARMRDDMDFAAGFQWSGQVKQNDERYISNITLRSVNQKVATLYAKDPKVIATARERMYFQIWDENVDTLMEAIQQSMQIQQAGVPLPVEIAALINDYAQGKERQKLIERVGRTLKIIYQYQVDTQKPEFKEQAKQAVRRVVTTSVAYGRPILCRDDSPEYKKINTTDTGSSTNDRVARMQGIVESIKDNDYNEEGSPRLETLRSLMLSVGNGAALETEDQLPERLEFDFPCATSMIIDPRCRNLKGFVAARWIAQEYILPAEEINAIMGTKIVVGNGEGYATQINKPADQFVAKESMQTDPNDKNCIALYEVWDYKTRTRFFICDGWPDYVMAPQKPDPDVAGFWNHFALVFNDIEMEPGCKATLYPPSDVQLLKSAQKEWNRSREALRDQRNANAPKYLVRKGMLTDDDKEAIRNALPNSVIELEGVPAEQPLERFCVPFQFARIDPALYDTAPLELDIQQATGTQQANLGPAQSNVTATVGAIAEQSRMNVSGSNVDDLDSWLTCLAQAGGEMLLKGMSREIAQRIAGPGAAWPDLPETRQDFCNEVLLRIEAASSGRPNKAIDIANARDLVPLLIQAGANPVGVVEELARRMDDNLDLDKFFPLSLAGAGGVAPGGPQGEQGGSQNAGPANSATLTRSTNDGGGEARRLDMAGASQPAVANF